MRIAAIICALALLVAVAACTKASSQPNTDTPQGPPAMPALNGTGPEPTPAGEIMPGAPPPPLEYGSTTTRTVRFEGLQCKDEPWQEWYAEGGVKFVKEPTDAELIIAYYGTVHSVQISNVERVERDGVACQACDVCPKGYYFTAQTTSAERMIELGWR